MSENYATIEKVADGFRAAGDKMNGLQAEVEELKLFSKELSSKLRQAMRVAGESGSEFSGGGFWQNEEMALAFGKTVISVARGEINAKGMGERVDALGGVMVPDEVARRFIDLLGRFGRFRANAMTFPLGGGSTTVPKIEQDLTVYCPGEGNDVTPSDMKFTGVKMIPKTWAVLAAVSNELDDDSVIAIGEIVGYSIARSMARQEDKVGFLGDGTAEYFGHTGILGAFLKLAEGDSANFNDVAGMNKGTGTAGWSGLVLQDFIDLASLLPEEYDDGAKWFCSKRFYYNVMYRLAAAAGTAGIAEILSTLSPKSFLGYPVVFTSVMPKVSPTGGLQVPCVLGDLQAGAYLGQRKSLTIAQSRDVLFGRYMTAILGVERIDVNVFGVGTANEPGPVVSLFCEKSGE